MTEFLSSITASSPGLWPTKAFAAGFTLQIMNPKAIVFWLAIAAVGAVTGAGPAIVAQFVAGAFLISFGCHAAWAVLLSSDPVRTGYQSVRRWVDGAWACFFSFASFGLATSRA